MTDSHPLDRPVWSALTSGWSALAEGDSRALRLQPDHGPFGAAADDGAGSLAALAELVPRIGELWLVETGDPALPPGVPVARTGTLHQMVAESITPSPHVVDFIELGEADAAEMRALAHLTKPGPFLPLTHRLGGFVGVRRDGKLVAMAGERMRIDGFAEVSGVCTHPDHRGRGHAGALMRIVMRRILERGETPILHSYAHNVGANALYESLGFRLRAALTLTVLTRDAG